MPRKVTEETKTEAPPAAGARAGNGYSVRALERGLHILKCFDVDHPGWTVGDLARQAGLHKATCFRLVKTLEAEGFLVQSPESGEYELGSALLRVAYLARSHGELVRLAHRHLEHLAALTGETVDLGVWTEDGILFVDQVLTSHPFKPEASVGRVFTDFGNAHSKILLAFGPEARREKLSFGGAGENRATLAEAVALSAEIEQVRNAGVAYDLQEQNKGICAVAVPVRDSTGEVVASLAVVAPEERFGAEARELHALSAREVALALSRQLGFSGR